MKFKQESSLKKTARIYTQALCPGCLVLGSVPKAIIGQKITVLSFKNTPKLKGHRASTDDTVGTLKSMCTAGVSLSAWLCLLLKYNCQLLGSISVSRNAPFLTVCYQQRRESNDCTPPTKVTTMLAS